MVNPTPDHQSGSTSVCPSLSSESLQSIRSSDPDEAGALIDRLSEGASFVVSSRRNEYLPFLHPSRPDPPSAAPLFLSLSLFDFGSEDSPSLSSSTEPTSSLSSSKSSTATSPRSKKSSFIGRDSSIFRIFARRLKRTLKSACSTPCFWYTRRRHRHRHRHRSLIRPLRTIWPLSTLLQSSPCRSSILSRLSGTSGSLSSLSHRHRGRKGGKSSSSLRRGLQRRFFLEDLEPDSDDQSPSCSSRDRTWSCHRSYAKADFNLAQYKEYSYHCFPVYDYDEVESPTDPESQHRLRFRKGPLPRQYFSPNPTLVYDSEIDYNMRTSTPRIVRNTFLSLVILIAAVILILNLYVVSLINRVMPQPKTMNPRYFAGGAAVNAGCSIFLVFVVAMVEKSYDCRPVMLMKVAASILSAGTAAALAVLYFKLNRCIGIGEWAGKLFPPEMFCQVWITCFALSVALSVGWIAVFISVSFCCLCPIYYSSLTNIISTNYSLLLLAILSTTTCPLKNSNSILILTLPSIHVLTLLFLFFLFASTH